ncbi:HalOD1 output domain-containing protein [Halegenticoccus soli]|uniref:HalOD1 output domain-containing protein n=1 Tax=Halegenticoccus soli TaxID=1985678 RepID=UPI00117B3BAD|nr:HalOD1 output domain-containing protein [Halegenticoccus soli]
MDEKSANSSPSYEPDHPRTEPASAERRVDAPTPGEVSDRGWTFVTQAHYDPGGPRDLTTVIISAIAEAEDVSLTDIKHPRLYELVDVTTIERTLFGQSETTETNREATVEFQYKQYKVRIEADGWVTVFDRSTEGAAERDA